MYNARIEAAKHFLTWDILLLLTYGPLHTFTRNGGAMLTPIFARNRIYVMTAWHIHQKF